jgi:hypothetical protein
LDVVAVSGANQYNVRPAALVTTCVPPIVLAISADPDELAAGALLVPAAAGALVAGLLAELDELAELPHAATASAAAARPATLIIFRIGRHLLTPCLISQQRSRVRRVIRSGDR